MNLRILPACFLFVPAICWAADEKPAHSDTMRCRMVAVGGAPTEELYVKTGGHFEPLPLSTDYIGKSFRTETKDGIVIYRKRPVSEPTKNSESKPDPFAVFATCNPEGKGRQLILVIPDGENAWKIIAKSDAEGDFPHGTRLVYNMSEFAMEFDFGGTKLVVHPRQTGLLRAPAKSQQELAHIKISRRSSDGKWTLFYNATWRTNGASRTLTLITPVGANKVSFSSIQDTIEAKDAEELKAEEK